MQPGTLYYLQHCDRCDVTHYVRENRRYWPCKTCGQKTEQSGAILLPTAYMLASGQQQAPLAASAAD